MAASTSRHRPVKGILKNKGPGLAPEEQACRAADGELAQKKSQKWDETSILATYRPAGADCGPAAADEPGAPGPRAAAGGDDDEAPGDAETPRCPAKPRPREPAAHDLSPEEQEKRRQFEVKRKLHDHEGLNIKLARQLLSKDLRDDDDDDAAPDSAECAGADEPRRRARAGDLGPSEPPCS